MTEAADDLLRRSFRIAGHRTSLSMERAFWDALKRIATRDQRSMTSIITEIDARRTSALSRAVRVYVLERARDA